MVASRLAARSGGMEVSLAFRAWRWDSHRSAFWVAGAPAWAPAVHLPIRQHPPHPQQFPQRPGLKRGTARLVRCITVGDFADVIETIVIQMLDQRRKKTRARLRLRPLIRLMHAQPCLDERTDQPRPHRSLVIGTVALHRTARVTSSIQRIGRRE